MPTWSNITLHDLCQPLLPALSTLADFVFMYRFIAIWITTFFSLLCFKDSYTISLFIDSVERIKTYNCNPCTFFDSMHLSNDLTQIKHKTSALVSCSWGSGHVKNTARFNCAGKMRYALKKRKPAFACVYPTPAMRARRGGQVRLIKKPRKAPGLC